MNEILLFICFFIHFPYFHRESMNFEHFKLYYVSLYHLFAAFPLHFFILLGRVMLFCMNRRNNALNRFALFGHFNIFVWISMTWEIKVTHSDKPAQNQGCTSSFSTLYRLFRQPYRCSCIIIAHTTISRMQEPQIACTPIRRDSTPPSPAPIAKMKMIP